MDAEDNTMNEHTEPSLSFDSEIDPTLIGVVREELERVPPARRAAAEAAIRAHLASYFVGTHAQHLAKWREVIQPFQLTTRRRPATAELETKSVDDVLDAVLMKLTGAFEIKDASKGQVQAIVSTMNVVDRDGDVMLPGAIPEGAVVKLSAYDHDVITEGLPPVGLGVISIKGDQAIMTGQYFLNTTRGRDAFETVKALGPHSEWSIGYRKNVRTVPMTDEWAKKGARRLIAGADVLESSPVFLGANGLTQTVATKQAEGDGDGAVAEDGTEKTPVLEGQEPPSPASEPGVTAVVVQDDTVAEEKAAEEAREFQLKRDTELATDIERTLQRFQRTMPKLRTA
jgi:hypothetical protein